MSMSQSKKRQCEYCPEKIDPRGYASHVHSRHRGEVLRQFRENPLVQFYCALEGIGRKQLPPAPDAIAELLTTRDAVVDRMLGHLDHYPDFAYLFRMVHNGSAPDDVRNDVKAFERVDDEISIRLPSVWFVPVFAQQ